MKLKLLSLMPVGMVMALLFANATQAADRIVKTYDIKNVDALVISGAVHVHVIQGETESLRAEATQDVMDRVSVDLTSQQLTLSVKGKGVDGFRFFNWFSNQNDSVTFILQVKNINSIELSGASQAMFDKLTGKNFKLEASGASDVTFSQLSMDNVWMNLSGACNLHFQQLAINKAKLELTGASNADVRSPSEAKSFSIEADGASNFHGKLLVASQVEASASGASGIEINATEFLKAEASGASNIYYLGQPKLQVESSGASHVKSVSN